jgi:hypothetical protein
MAGLKSGPISEAFVGHFLSPASPALSQKHLLGILVTGKSGAISEAIVGHFSSPASPALSQKELRGIF